MIRCGEVAQTLPEVPVGISYAVPEVPRRRDLAFLDDVAQRLLPEDPTPSLAEISARPKVDHLGDPGPDPRTPINPVRLVVVGSDVALAAVITRVMRADYTWMEIAFVPTQPSSPIATSWGLDPQRLWATALSAPALPTPLIRDDTGMAIPGVAEIRTDAATNESATTHSGSTTDSGDGDAPDKNPKVPSNASSDSDSLPPLAAHFKGEVLVDETSLIFADGAEITTAPNDPSLVACGVRLAATTTAPGIAAIPLYSAPRQRRFPWSKTPKTFDVVADPQALITGRAVQAGGPALRIIREGVIHPRPVERATFYRHLRDIQIVRNAD